MSPDLLRSRPNRAFRPATDRLERRDTPGGLLGLPGPSLHQQYDPEGGDPMRVPPPASVGG